MCYMEQVGVRELRQNLSVYLRRIKQGERLEVTEHGRPVAVLSPPPEATGSMSALERLIAEGKATRPTRDLLTLKPIQLPPGSPSASELLRRMREEERY